MTQSGSTIQSRENEISDEKVKARIQDKAKLISEGEDFNLETLPIMSSHKRNSSKCRGVEEEVFLHELEIEDDDDGQLYSVIIERIVVIDESVEAISIADEAGDHEAFRSVFVRPYLNCLSSDSDELVNIVKKDYLVNWDGQDYNFSVPVSQLDHTSLQGEIGQPLEVDKLVFKGEVKNGFFIEAGAFDSETNSDTLYFEINHNWTGLLVEPHPLAFHRGLSKHRKATSVQTCLSTSGEVETFNFDMTGSVRNESTRESMSGLVTHVNEKTIQMQCFPLYTLLLAMGNPTVHFFSLDIEGAEFPVLRTIPWDKVDIRVLTVESHLAGRIYSGTRAELINYMESVGYQHLPDAFKETNEARETMGTTDDLFVRKDVLMPNNIKAEL